jgi:hypothetical protein
MRAALAISAVLFVLLELAAGQSSIPSGYTGNVVPGLYALPSPPLVTTPSISFSTPSLARGATNTTVGNTAGAVFATPIWYGEVSAPEAVTSFSGTPGGAAGFNWGAALLPDSHSVLELGATRIRPGSRLYTNSDAEKARERELQAAGTVRYRGKTERLD